jgi:hypothetical protein
MVFRNSPIVSALVAGGMLCFVMYAVVTLAYDTGRRALGAEISYVCAP